MVSFYRMLVGKTLKKIIQLKRFSLADQLYRSVGSISANIIEGYSRISKKEKQDSMKFLLDQLAKLEIGISKADTQLVTILLIQELKC